MKTFYAIRSGWNSANQSSRGACRNPRNQFESHQYALVGMIEAESEEAVIEQVGATCYNNQYVFAVSNPRSVAGLTAAIKAQNAADDSCYA